MSLTISKEILSGTTAPALAILRKSAELSYSSDVTVDVGALDAPGLAVLASLCRDGGDVKSANALDAIAIARDGVFSKPIPNFKAFQAILGEFLRRDAIDAWIYVERADGSLSPELVTGIVYEPGRRQGGPADPQAQVFIRTTYYGVGSSYGRSSDRVGVRSGSYAFRPTDVARRRVADVLAASGIYKETPALKERYLASMQHYDAVMVNGFGEQFLTAERRRVVHDLPASDMDPAPPYAPSDILAGDDATGPIPVHPDVRIFDLRSHTHSWAHADGLERYVYDDSLRDKLVLPMAHRDLLDVLTSDIDAFVGDIIDGKSAGNVILCKGVPGVGKTLTAEVYAELIHRPLYSVHAGTLGTTAKDIEGTLQKVFARTKRWNAVLLLDEADVFVERRGSSLEQNAIVAEFLRTLEYFDGLMFMTTNRPTGIDEAIISRCAAIIGYDLPTREDTRRIWGVMASQQSTTLDPALLDGLLGMFRQIAPRDIKMLLRLALRVSRAHGKDLDLDTFRRCAMFRAIAMDADAPAT